MCSIYTDEPIITCRENMAIVSTDRMYSVTKKENRKEQRKRGRNGDRNKGKEEEIKKKTKL